MLTFSQVSKPSLSASGSHHACQTLAVSHEQGCSQQAPAVEHHTATAAAGIGNMDNARALFERALTAATPGGGPRLWDRFLAFEHEHGSLAAALAIQVMLHTHNMRWHADLYQWSLSTQCIDENATLCLFCRVLCCALPSCSDMFCPVISRHVSALRIRSRWTACVTGLCAYHSTGAKGRGASRGVRRISGAGGTTAGRRHPRVPAEVQVHPRGPPHGGHPPAQQAPRCHLCASGSREILAR